MRGRSIGIDETIHFLYNETFQLKFIGIDENTIGIDEKKHFSYNYYTSIKTVGVA